MGRTAGSLRSMNDKAKGSIVFTTTEEVSESESRNTFISCEIKLDIHVNRELGAWYFHFLRSTLSVYMSCPDFYQGYFGRAGYDKVSLKLFKNGRANYELITPRCFFRDCSLVLLIRFRAPMTGISSLKI